MRSHIKSVAQAMGLRRGHVAAARMWGERHALAVLGSRRFKSNGRILCYHSVDEPEMGVNDVSERRFREQIELALERGYRFVAPSQIARGEGSERDLAITFDDGRKSMTTHAARILAEYNIPWTLFIVTRWTEQKETSPDSPIVSWKDIEALRSSGVEIGSHSQTHPDFGRIEDDQLADELIGSRRIIEKRLGFSPTSFAIPLGQSMNWTDAADRVAREAGYEIVYAQAEETCFPGTVPRTFVTAFDNPLIFGALLEGAYDRWEEWV
jgi:peptidoglycan/xylan/chitin deacetylase (PgdA/CDA1 family)